MSRFQTIEADDVVSISVVEDERLLAVRQNLVGSLLRRYEGWAVLIAAHKVVGAVCQSGRYERRSGAVRGGEGLGARSRTVSRSCGRNRVAYWVSCPRGTKSPGTVSGAPYTSSAEENSISSLGAVAHAEQDTWQFVEPIRSMETSHQCGVVVTVEYFHKSVRLWVVRGGAV